MRKTSHKQQQIHIDGCGQKFWGQEFRTHRPWPLKPIEMLLQFHFHEGPASKAVPGPQGTGSPCQGFGTCRRMTLFAVPLASLIWWPCLHRNSWQLTRYWHRIIVSFWQELYFGSNPYLQIDKVGKYHRPQGQWTILKIVYFRKSLPTLIIVQTRRWNECHSRVRLIITVRRNDSKGASMPFKRGQTSIPLRLIQRSGFREGEGAGGYSLKHFLWSNYLRISIFRSG